MSSFKKAIKRRAHQERAQPSSRERLGLLEKHKDYVLRARDYNRKKDTLRVLREKAANRNPDEFYFKMERSGFRDGVHAARVDVEDDQRYTPEELRLMKMQDINYIRMKAQVERRKVEKIQPSLQSIDETKRNKHVLFAEDVEDLRLKAAMVAEKKEGGGGGEGKEGLRRHLNKARKAAYRELMERKERAQKLRMMLQKMAMEKELLGKGDKRLVHVNKGGDGNEDDTGGQCSVYVWKQERKR
ncbi:hypothetical protein CBR_g26482 [Chara braunii]|uniref:U3 small nucleolar RNA-associated protein 11 n=1 Tax=Chara braunii TaxID=69332 RepID=A0A388L891_CHABU|nr:hypothetical protein CBR_g26482 [Chara braunii]|eukprot:GBG78452.1 hypothetical protein CBR_g26482 [Chara braunii]